MARYFRVDTEHVSGRALRGAFDRNVPGMEAVVQCFVDDYGQLMLEMEGYAVDWPDKIRAAVWAVNGGAYCDVRELTGDQFDAYC